MIMRRVALLLLLFSPLTAGWSVVPSSNGNGSNEGKLRTTTAVATTGLLLLLSSPAFADVDNGAQLFQANCASCHGGGNNIMSAKKTLKKDALEKYVSLDQTKLQAFVETQMPHTLLPFKKTFSNQDYADVVSFVRDQAVNEKW
jgi:cytochrome c6